MLVCSMDEMGRSRMVFPRVGRPKKHKKPDDIKVDPSYLVETYFLQRSLLMSTTASFKIKPPSLNFKIIDHSKTCCNARLRHG